MAWVDVTGSSGVWQYENAATAANSYTDSAAGANSTVSGGIRTHTRPGTSAVTKTYLRVRKKGQINLLPYSEQFDNNYWGSSGVNRTANSIIAPDGTTTADKIISTSTSGAAIIKTPAGVTLGGVYTMSVFVKAGDTNIFRIANKSSGTTGAWFNLTDGTILTQNGGTNSSTMKPVGDGWYRCTRTFASLLVPSSGNNTIIFGNCGSDGSTGGPAIGKFIYLWGAMMSEGTIVTPYIKTVASASTTIERGEVSKTYFDAQ